MLVQLLVGGAASLANIAIHSVWTVYLDRILERYWLRGKQVRVLPKRVVLMMATVAILMLGHLAEALVWAATYAVVNATPAGARQQTRNPKEMDVGKERKKPEQGDDLELQLMGFVGDPLGQSVQPKEQDAKHQHRARKDHGHHDHQNVCPTGSGNERGQMGGGSGMKRSSHTAPHSGRR